MFIRSKLEHSSVVWNSGITQDEREDLERIQKAAVRVILRNKNAEYEKALDWLNIRSKKNRFKFEVCKELPEE